MVIKEKLRDIARDTLKIIKNGEYSAQGKLYDIKDQVAKSRENTEVYRSHQSLPSLDKVGKGTITVSSLSTLKAALLMDEGTVILNFASAKHPGGGFQNGSMAQEESLCYASSLYDSIGSQSEFYRHNHANLNSGLYTDGMIYTPNMVVIRDDDHKLTAPWTCSCITAAAPNRLATRRRPDIDKQVPVVMARRILSILNLAVHKGHKSIVLGAFGCGVFRNDPEVVSGLFKSALYSKGYIKYFDAVAFAMKSTDYNYRVFEKTFADLR